MVPVAPNFTVDETAVPVADADTVEPALTVTLVLPLSEFVRMPKAPEPAVTLPAEPAAVVIVTVPLPLADAEMAALFDPVPLDETVPAGVIETLPLPGLAFIP